MSLVNRRYLWSAIVDKIDVLLRGRLFATPAMFCCAGDVDHRSFLLRRRCGPSMSIMLETK
jgi:hypothetical protein